MKIVCGFRPSRLLKKSFPCQNDIFTVFQQPARTALLCLAVLIVGTTTHGCSGSSSSAYEDGKAKAYTANLGTATLFDMTEKTRQMLLRHQFQIIRFESTTDATFFETDWRPRYPFEDEIELGIEEARTRLMITATPRTRAAMGSDLNTVRLEAENQVRYRNAVDWHYVEMSKMLKAYLREFADRLATDLRAGIRRY